MLSIARSELIQIVRNRAVLLTGFIMPVAASAFFVYYRDVFERIGSLGYIAAVIVFTIGAFSLFSATVTTLAARRQNLFLKRLRSTAAGDPAILSGLVLPVGVISLVQVGLMLGVFAAVSDGPANVPLLAAAIVSTFAMMLALGIATAGVTRSPEHAQITTLPPSLGVVVVASWVGITGTESLPLLKRLLPGGRQPSSSSTPGTVGSRSPTRCSCWVRPSPGSPWRSRSPRGCSAGSRVGDP